MLTGAPQLRIMSAITGLSVVEPSKARRMSSPRHSSTADAAASSVGFRTIPDALRNEIRIGLLLTAPPVEPGAGAPVRLLGGGRNEIFKTPVIRLPDPVEFGKIPVILLFREFRKGGPGLRRVIHGQLPFIVEMPHEDEIPVDFDHFPDTGTFAVEHIAAGCGIMKIQQMPSVRLPRGIHGVFEESVIAGLAAARERMRRPETHKNG